MKMRTRSTMEQVKGLFWCALFLFAAWSVGYLQIALIGSVSILLLLWIVGTVTTASNPEQNVTIYPLYSPAEWKGVHDNVWDIFMTSGTDKDEVVVARFLHHINAIVDERQPLFREADRAVHFKMLYEYQRKYGSLEYKNKTGLPVITAPETLRPLSNEERPAFIAFCHQRFDDYINGFSRAHDKADQRVS